MSGNRFWRQQGLAAQTLSLMLSALLIGIPVSGAAAADESNAAVNAVLAIASDPAGASVYVDGQFVGETPLNVDRLSAGDHRVRVVKNGYLENGRIVSVSASKTNTLAIKLTPNNNASETTQVISGTGGGGGMSKWLWLGIAGGGAAAAAAYVLTRNKPPIAGTIGVSPAGTGMLNVTSFSFTSQGASDPNDDPLTFSWGFGDGSSGSGASASKTYSSTGTFTVSLTVSDGKEEVTAPSVTVTVGPAVGGTWTGGREPTFGCGITANLTQSGGTLSGTMGFASPCFGSVTLASASLSSPLTHPNTVTWTTQSFSFNSGGTIFPNLTIRFTGPTSSSGTTMSGTITVSQSSSGFTQSASTSFTKQ